MNQNQQKAMFAKGKTKYKSFTVAKTEYRLIAKRDGIKTPDQAWKHLAKLRMADGIPKRPDIVYSKKNVEANQKAGIDIRKEVYY